MNLTLARLQRVILTLWLGAMWSVGYLVVPVLFGALDDAMLAGRLAGELFQNVAWLGMVCAAAILMLQFSRGNGAPLPRLALWCVFAMLVLVLVGQFGIDPIIADLKAQAGPEGVGAGPLKEAFAKWHGVASVLYLCQSLVGLIAVWRSAAPVPGDR